ncbi:MAG TPA: PEP/pyruvate-binding domain-containing protein [Thermodesulfobacteriota bacterium]|nr:PEP/pyruvate-binding domain-containing protein [Thermodesulfobacteriota bacterium]
MFKILARFKKSKVEKKKSSPQKSFLLHKYDHFKAVLSENNRALTIITDLEHIFYEDRPFDWSYVQNEAGKLVETTCRIAEDLNALTGAKYPDLFDAAEKVSLEIFQGLERKKPLAPTALVLPLEQIGQEQVVDVGGKAANLGEIQNRVHLPVPQGFAVSAYACQHFLSFNHFPEKIERMLEGLEVNDTERLMNVSQEIRSLVIQGQLPPDLEEALLRAITDLREKIGTPMRLAVRSSATSEDSESSFAGQHSTVLNVNEETFLSAYKQVVASTFNPRAIFYRRSKGYLDEDVIMSIACIAMVDALSSGVLYTVDPNNSSREVILISAVWGLGVSLVDGSFNSDFYQINKRDRSIEIEQVARKEVRVYADPVQGIKEGPVAHVFKEKPCLTRSQIKLLVEYALQLEAHYQVPLDIEWAIDQGGKLFILQARPLRFAEETAIGESKEEIEDEVLPILLRGGASAAKGTASGLAYVIKSDHNLLNIPEGAILIAPQTSPRLVPIIGKVQAIVTDVGSVTGHMASVAREFQIPTLVDTENATAVIPHGQVITVDATNAVIYQGRIEKLLQKGKPINPMHGSPIYKALQTILKKIAPLHLIDPKQENFKPASCETIHDIIRFSHEIAMQEMFQIGENIENGKNVAIRFRSKVPLDLYLVDLGGGLEVPPEQKEARPENILSIPFKSLYQGMTHEGIQWLGQERISWSGLGSVFMENILHDPLTDGNMGGPSYAVLSEKYLNFNSRLGYHFATLDTYCGQNINNNYVTFYFKGGAADIERRTRRAQLIASILKKMGFRVEQRGDMIKGELKKLNSYLIQEKLDLIGRLMGAMRTLDMHMNHDQHIEWYRNEFFKGNYTFERNPQPANEQKEDSSKAKPL